MQNASVACNTPTGTTQGNNNWKGIWAHHALYAYLRSFFGFWIYPFSFSPQWSDNAKELHTASHNAVNELREAKGGNKATTSSWLIKEAEFSLFLLLLSTAQATCIGGKYWQGVREGVPLFCNCNCKTSTAAKMCVAIAISLTHHGPTLWNADKVLKTKGVPLPSPSSSPSHLPLPHPTQQNYHVAFACVLFAFFCI